MAFCFAFLKCTCCISFSIPISYYLKLKRFSPAPKLFQKPMPCITGTLPNECCNQNPDPCISAGCCHTPWFPLFYQTASHRTTVSLPVCTIALDSVKQ